MMQQLMIQLSINDTNINNDSDDKDGSEEDPTNKY